MNTIQRLSFPLACLLLACSAHAGGRAAEQAPGIVSLRTQSCAGPAMVEWVVHPRRQEFQSQGWMPVGDTGYRIDFDRMGRFRQWTLAERLHDTSRKVDDSYVLLNAGGMGPYSAAFVVTRMPPGEQMSDEALLHNALRVQLLNAGDRAPSFIEVETPFGKGIEMVVGGRVGSYCFPTAPFFYASNPGEASIGISRFVARNGDLIEYALVLAWPEGVVEAEMIAKAQAELSILQAALTEMPRR